MNAIERDQQQIKELAKKEIKSQSLLDILSFALNFLWRGRYCTEKFTYYGANPSSVDRSKPAVLFLHGYGGNQGTMIPMLRHLKRENCFTLNYTEDPRRQLEKRVDEIRKLYLEDPVDLILVGHSRGGTEAADYGFDPDSWPEGLTVKKVIVIDGRVKPVDNPPFASQSSDLLPRLERIWKRVSEKRGGAELWTAAPEDPWLVPRESADVAEEGKRTIIPGVGHFWISQAQKTCEFVATALASSS